MHLPKILFLADEIPQSKNAGSIQFLRIFKDYPPDRLLVVGRKPDPTAQLLNCQYVELSFRKADRIRLSRFSRFLADGEALGVLNYRLPSFLQSRVDEFNPDVVITLMQLFMYYQTAYHYAKSKSKPLIVFCHDNVESFSRVHRLLKNRLIKKNASVYQYASHRLSISPEMAGAWELKYKAKGDVMYPMPGDISARSANESLKLLKPDRLIMGFAGSMAYGYAEGIKELIPTLEESNVYLRIYNSPSSTLPVNASSHIEFCGYASTPDETWDRIKSECDGVVLPYSFDLKFKELYETHFPSKLPEYLSLGVPVIIVGPHYATGVKWGLSNLEAGCTTINYKQLSDVFNEIRSRPLLRVELSHDSIRLRDKEFDPQHIRNLFFEYVKF